MAYHWTDSVHTAAFTPREYQVELLDAAREKNIVTFLPQSPARGFIALKLIQELATEVRKSYDDSGKRTLYLVQEDRVASISTLLGLLTDLRVGGHTSCENVDWDNELRQKQVLVMTSQACDDALVCSYVDLTRINLLLIDDCHGGICEDDPISQIMQKCHKDGPRVVGFTGPLYNTGCYGGTLQATLALLEKALGCQAETASDVLSVLRYCTQPSELLVECDPSSPCQLDTVLAELISNSLGFINDHVFNPSEIYSDDFADDLQAMPDPKVEPTKVLIDFLDVLNNLGPWCADRAASILLAQIEKQKIKTPYERHYLLLCLVSTTLIKVRAECDYVFKKLDTEKERIIQYSTPKVYRLIEIMRIFKPEGEEPLNECRLFQSDDKLKNRTFSQDTIKNNNCDAVLNICADTTSNSNTLSNNLNNEMAKTENLIKTLNVSTLNMTDIGQQIQTKEILSNGCVTKIRKNLDKLNQQIDECNFKSLSDNISVACERLIDGSGCGDMIEGVRLICDIYTDNKRSLLDADVEIDPVKNTERCSLIPAFNKDVSPNRRADYTRCRGRNTRRGGSVVGRAPCNRYVYGAYHPLDPDSLCGIIFVKNKLVAQILYALLYEMSRHDNDLSFINIQYTVGKTADPVLEPRDAEVEHRKQEEVLRRFRMHECNVLIGTSVLEQGIDLPRCNLVVRWDEPMGFSSYAHCKGRARALGALHVTMVPPGQTEKFVTKFAEYMEIEKMLLLKCTNIEPSSSEEKNADRFTNTLQCYQPMYLEGSPSVSLATAVALVNRYCAKLPSDTFTRLTPLWRIHKLTRNGCELYRCTLRLPINSPLKKDIVGVPMPSQVLARRVAALQTCVCLHRSGELDNMLQPIGKESFKLQEAEPKLLDLERAEEQDGDTDDPRPGTTKRRQYYYKRIANALSFCRPIAGVSCYLYHIAMELVCSLPEEQNTRGRMIHAPEKSPHGFGILTLKSIPKISPFSIFTRSGEVKISLKLLDSSVVPTEEQITKIGIFIDYTFTSVLRLQKHLMLFDLDASENSYFVVPTIRDVNNAVSVDWIFLDTIAAIENHEPEPVSDEVRKATKFNVDLYTDAVVMPWYRNQDQPQYFYVAEICGDLTPKSPFPGEAYNCFEEYYLKKYGIQVQNLGQPLLDVDHTSARLNFLTPRYVNRKGVALPTSSEETKRAKREDLGNKQILVPELCAIHPFPGALWRAAVCLPCILYRINGLLIADQIRRIVADCIGLGKKEVPSDFEWPKLDFGWSLSDVFNKNRETKEIEMLNNSVETNIVDKIRNKLSNSTELNTTNNVTNDSDSTEKTSGFDDDEEQVEEKKLLERSRKSKDEVLEIGTWSNDMADCSDSSNELESSDMQRPLTMYGNSWKKGMRYGSPTSWDASNNICRRIVTMSDDSDIESYDSGESEEESDGSETGGLRIEFKSDTLAEAIETDAEIQRIKPGFVGEVNNKMELCWRPTNIQDELYMECTTQYERTINSIKQEITTTGILIKSKDPLPHRQLCSKTNTKLLDTSNNKELLKELLPFYTEPISKDIITVDDLIQINNAYLERNGFDKVAVVTTADYFEGINVDLETCNGEAISPTVNINIHGENDDKQFGLIPQSSKKLEKFTCDGVGACHVEDQEQRLWNPKFSFDYQPDLSQHPGPSPSVILQALTMSNANDGINLERLETIGDSFLKYAITSYLYCFYDNIHEGKLSHMRSMQVSNLHLYRLGRLKDLGENMIALKFEPHDNWLPPCYYVPRDLDEAIINANIPPNLWNHADLPSLRSLNSAEIRQMVNNYAVQLDEQVELSDDEYEVLGGVQVKDEPIDEETLALRCPEHIPYNLITQHSIPDKSIADCVEALIGAYLIECGPRGALLFMSWLGIRVLPVYERNCDGDSLGQEQDDLSFRIPGSTKPVLKDGHWCQTYYGVLLQPRSPLLHTIGNPERALNLLLDGYDAFESILGYKFNNRAYLLQAMTHASYTPNRLTDCYQRLEFLGDAVLDYLITRFLYDCPLKHSPGALTDLRSALVNNTIFASLAVRHGFHKYFRHMTSSLQEVIDRFVQQQEANNHAISEEFYLLEEDECDEVEDVEVPKALGDVFESVAGAIFLDSGMQLDVVWRVYHNMMYLELELFSKHVPKSPIRELLEMEPETAKFGKPEKLADGRRVRVTVEVVGKGSFKGIGRNYRIAKCTAAKCALKQLKNLQKSSSGKKR